MDSLTQIVLGAAVGEITLGKKVGNRAILWGAVGGTIPDLDVITGFFVSEIQELAYHRGFSHSIVFSILGAFLFGYLIHRMYASSYHRWFAFLGWFGIPMGIGLFMTRIFDVSTVSWLPLMGVLGIMGYALYRRYFMRVLSPPEASVRDWQWLFFWSLLTHPILDCFTTYGTQLFQPFSSYRVAFNAISVADPIYTTPFLLCIIALCFYHRANPLRRRLAWIGIGISSAYLLFTVVNKTIINSIWTETLERNSINYQRYMTSPTILNNILWFCLAETEEGYYYGLYSHFDSERGVQYSFIPHDKDLIDPKKDDFTINTLTWFANDYYNITEEAGQLIMNDLRFGIYDEPDGSKGYIFRFPLKEKSDGYYELSESQAGPKPEDRERRIRELFERIKGI